MGVPITPLKLQATPWQLSLHRIAVAGAGVVGLSLEKWWGKNVYFFVDTPKHESTKVVVWCRFFFGTIMGTHNLHCYHMDTL